MELPRSCKTPTFHFIIVGAAAFVLFGMPSQRATIRSAPPREIVIEAAELRNRSVDELIEEEILVQEALALGLDRDERIVEARLAAIGSFLELDPEAGAAGLAAKARSLRLHETDPIVRRHLASLMRLYLSQLGAGDWPSEEELRKHAAESSTDLASPSRIHLTHVFLSRDRRGAALQEDASRLHAELSRGLVMPESTRRLGDPFGHGTREITATQIELAKTFGPGFAEAMSRLEPASWSHPIPSPYGAHLVWIHERLPSGTPPLAEVRSRILHRLLAERRRARFAARFAALRDRYRIRTAWN